VIAKYADAHVMPHLESQSAHPASSQHPIVALLLFVSSSIVKSCCFWPGTTRKRKPTV
jgi:hypothetical protein